jgi:molecular chaperone GrpE
MKLGGEAHGTTGSDDPHPSSTPSGHDKETAEASDWETRYKYLLADFENFRRRTERERAGARVDAEAVLLRRLIPLVEGFQSAEAAGRTLPPSDPLRRGLELLGRELNSFLKSIGFAPVARIGEPFRPEEHEAVGETAAVIDVDDGHVAEIVQQGYRFQGGLLRPAKVLVARVAHRTETSADLPAAPEPVDGPPPPDGDAPE